MVNICKKSHLTIVFTGQKCPLCKAIQSLKNIKEIAEAETDNEPDYTLLNMIVSIAETTLKKIGEEG